MSPYSDEIVMGLTPLSNLIVASSINAKTYFFLIKKKCKQVHILCTNERGLRTCLWVVVLLRTATFCQLGYWTHARLKSISVLFFAAAPQFSFAYLSSGFLRKTKVGELCSWQYVFLFVISKKYFSRNHFFHYVINLKNVM